MWQGFVNSSLLHTLFLNPKPKSHLGCEYCREKRYPVLKFFEAAFPESFSIPLPKGTEKKKVSGAQKLFRIFWEAFRSLYPGTVLSQAFKFHSTKGNLEFRCPLQA